jgi:hypothetical protein
MRSARPRADTTVRSVSVSQIASRLKSQRPKLGVEAKSSASGMTANGRSVSEHGERGGGRFKSFFVGIVAVATAIVAAYGRAELLRERTLSMK